MPNHRISSLIGLVLGASSLLISACSDEPSVAEALAMNAEKKFEEEQYKPKADKKPPPKELLPPPTEAEIAAWDRKDPTGEKHLYKWDKRNAKRMQNYWNELRCFRDKMKLEGQKAFGSEPQSAEDERWYQFKRIYIPMINRWQQRLFANEPRILEKSKYISNILEAHELVMHGYPKAFNDGNELEIKKADAHWMLVEDKVKRYSDQIGVPYKLPDLEKPREKKKWDAFCAKAEKEPDPKKAKKRRGKKSSI